MHSAQAGIQPAVPLAGRYLVFSIADGAGLAPALQCLSELAGGTTMGVGLDASVVAARQWLHDLDAFDAMEPAEQDASVGRRREGNVELTEAPSSARVQRTAQDRFSKPLATAYFWCPPMRGGRLGLRLLGL